MFSREKHSLDWEIHKCPARPQITGPVPSAARRDNILHIAACLLRRLIRSGRANLPGSAGRRNGSGWLLPRASAFQTAEAGVITKMSPNQGILTVLKAFATVLLRCKTNFRKPLVSLCPTKKKNQKCFFALYHCGGI